MNPNQNRLKPKINPVKKEGKPDIDGIDIKKQGNKSTRRDNKSMEQESFEKHYNKELKVSEDEIPMVLIELCDTATQFMARDNHEKALLLLQKAHGVLDVVDLSRSRRDQAISLQIFQNMAHCYQKSNRLEECSICLETCLEQMSIDIPSFKEISIASRIAKMKNECKTKLQQCAILSQLHQHKAALDMALQTCQLICQIVDDDIQLCQFYANRLDFEQIKTELDQGKLDDNSAARGQEVSTDSAITSSNYMSSAAFHNGLEESISIVERSAKKLLKIYQVLRQKIVSVQEGDQIETEKIDANMRHMIGFLNQSEWVNSLNIGNIMQILPLRREDLVGNKKNEDELGRESFLETLSFIIVTYFCMSTEIRFIIQLKDFSGLETWDIDKKNLESEYWHTKSLELACAFLPSDCPLLNHVLLSYQKHHSPSATAIQEGSVQNDDLEVIKPVEGIDNCKFQPIVKKLVGVQIDKRPRIRESAKPFVDKILADINPVDPKEGQQASGQNRLKIKQVQKLDKIVVQFSKKLGIEKGQLLGLLIGKSATITTSQTPTTIQKESSPINTGGAAKVAYNNLFSPEENLNQQHQKLRSAKQKSRNPGTGQSLTENNQFMNSNQQENDPFLSDIRKSLGDGSFSELVQEGSKSSKRDDKFKQNQNEKIIHRPKSSKGHRGLSAKLIYPVQPNRKIAQKQEQMQQFKGHQQIRPHSETGFTNDTAPKFIAQKDKPIYHQGALPMQDLKKVKLNYEELKKYLIKESHQIAKQNARAGSEDMNSAQSRKGAPQRVAKKQNHSQVQYSLRPTSQGFSNGQFIRDVSGNKKQGKLAGQGKYVFNDMGVVHHTRNHKGSGQYVSEIGKQAKSGFDLFDPCHPNNQSFTSGVVGRNSQFENRRLSEGILIEGKRNSIDRID